MNIQGWMKVVQVMGGLTDSNFLGVVCDLNSYKVKKIQSIRYLRIGIGAIVNARMH